MSVRTAKQGKSIGEHFWGCSRYPKCKGTVTFVDTENHQNPNTVCVRPVNMSLTFLEMAKRRKKTGW